jgi:hypothetical protein
MLYHFLQFSISTGPIIVAMRRVPSIATFALLIALLPAFSQMRGGGHGFSGGRGSSTGPAFRGMSSGSRFSGPRFQSRGFTPGFSFRHRTFFRGDRFRADRFRADRFRHHRFRNFGFGNCFDCNGPWGWPWWDGDYDSSYDEDRQAQIAEAREMNAQNLEEQRMRRQEDREAYSQLDPPRQMRAAETTETPAPPTVLVFRDKREQEIQNYAIVGRTLWNFALQRIQKIPLEDLDLAATAKANDDRGIDFRVPATGEGQ